SVSRKLRKPTRWIHPPLGNCRILRVETIHRSGIAESHARQRSTAQELRNPGAVTFHLSEIAESHARQRSITQELQNLTHGNVPPLRNRGIDRKSVVHRSEIAESTRESRQSL